jgi:hypothetical protein
MTGSEIAKSGYALEDSIEIIFNNDSNFRKILCNIIDMPEDSFAKTVERQKHDLIIKNSDATFSKNIQVKRYKGSGFNQVDRRAVEKWGQTLAKSFVEQLSEFTGFKYYPLKKRKKPCELSKDFQDTLHLFQEEIILSSLMEYSNVDYFIFVNWDGQMTVAKDDDVLDLLLSEPLVISPTKTTISLGKHISWQRKGGDNGKISATDLQTKLKVGKVVEELIKNNKAQTIDFCVYN